MIKDVVAGIEDSIKDPDGLTRRLELIMDCSSDEPGAAGNQDRHERWLAERGSGSDTSKRQPPATLRTEIAPSCDSTTPRAMANPRPAPPSSPLRDGVPRQPASKTRARLVSGMPPQLSMTATRM